jgi:hypothetical protein
VLGRDRPVEAAAGEGQQVIVGEARPPCPTTRRE